MNSYHFPSDMASLQQLFWVLGFFLISRQSVVSVTLPCENYLGEAYFLQVKLVNASHPSTGLLGAFCMYSSLYPDHMHYSRANN